MSCAAKAGQSVRNSVKQEGGEEEGAKHRGSLRGIPHLGNFYRRQTAKEREREREVYLSHPTFPAHSLLFLILELSPVLGGLPLAPETLVS